MPNLLASHDEVLFHKSSVVLAQRAGVEPGMLVEAVSKGSGDSFVLRKGPAP